MNHSMKRLSYFAFTICLVFGALTANAQFNKPLQSPSQRKTSNVAKYNVGISGGLSLTHWIHTGGLETISNNQSLMDWGRFSEFPSKGCSTAECQSVWKDSMP